MSRIILIFRGQTPNLRASPLIWNYNYRYVTGATTSQAQKNRSLWWMGGSELGFTWDDVDNDMSPLVTDSDTENEDDKYWQPLLGDLNYDILNNNHISYYTRRQKPGLTL